VKCEVKDWGKISFYNYFVSHVLRFESLSQNGQFITKKHLS
jgi:hypothetical protein